MKQLVIAIDGYSSCGKSTTAKAVAHLLHYAYVDTGAMYRGVTLYLLEHGILFDDLPAVEQALKKLSIGFRRHRHTGRNELFLDSVNREDDIRQMVISNSVSEVSVIPQVRHAMVAQQQRMGRKRGVVMDGRDIGTTVFPDAEVKIFMTADMELRARRRQMELAEKGRFRARPSVVSPVRGRLKLNGWRGFGTVPACGSGPR